MYLLLHCFESLLRFEFGEVSAQRPEFVDEGLQDPEEETTTLFG